MSPVFTERSRMIRHVERVGLWGIGGFYSAWPDRHTDCMVCAVQHRCIEILPGSTYTTVVIDSAIERELPMIDKPQPWKASVSGKLLDRTLGVRCIFRPSIIIIIDVRVTFIRRISTS